MVFGNEYNQIGMEMFFINTDVQLFLSVSSCVTTYGLSAAVITNDLQKAMEMSELLEAGMVHINGPTIRDEGIIPFGGVKSSGLGREGGRFAIDELTELKWVTVQGGQQKFPPSF